jgi:hypothetical protein
MGGHAFAMTITRYQKEARPISFRGVDALRGLAGGREKSRIEKKMYIYIRMLI